jgi:hypothetical protein
LLVTLLILLASLLNGGATTKLSQATGCGWATLLFLTILLFTGVSAVGG